MAKIYPSMPSAPYEASYKEKYYIDTLISFKNDLLNLERNNDEKYKQLKRKSNRFYGVNITSNTIAALTGISGITTSLTVVGLPISLVLGSISLGSVFVSSVSIIFIQKNQKNINKNRKVHK